MAEGDVTNEASAQGAGRTSQAATVAAPRKGTVTLEGLQKELGAEKGLREYVRLGEPFGITELNVVEFHPPLDLGSIQKTKE
jgi:hypothetical protein